MNFDAMKQHGHATAKGHGGRHPRHPVHGHGPHPIMPPVLRHQPMHGMAEMAEMSELGQFPSLAQIPGLLTNAGQISSNVANVTSQLSSPQMTQTINRAVGDAETYITVQLGLQAVASIAAFGVFLIMFHKFVRERK